MAENDADPWSAIHVDGRCKVVALAPNDATPDKEAGRKILVTLLDSPRPGR